MGTPQERKFQRFNLSYPVHVRFRSRDFMAEVDVVSSNISIGGLLLESPVPIPDRSPVEFTITLTGAPISRSITLEGSGEVVRVEKLAQTGRFGIAVACAEPIARIEDYLTVAPGREWTN